MTTAHDIMHKGAQCVDAEQSLMEAAQLMRDLGVGSLPICGSDDKLKGIITDRDIVIRCCAEGRDPAAVKAGEFSGELFWVDGRADISEVLHTMEEHQIRRLPVIENHQLVGIVSEADVARRLTDQQVAEFATKVYAAR